MGTMFKTELKNAFMLQYMGILNGKEYTLTEEYDFSSMLKRVLARRTCDEIFRIVSCQLFWGLDTIDRSTLSDLVRLEMPILDSNIIYEILDDDEVDEYARPSWMFQKIQQVILNPSSVTLEQLFPEDSDMTFNEYIQMNHYTNLSEEKEMVSDSIYEFISYESLHPRNNIKHDSITSHGVLQKEIQSINRTTEFVPVQYRRRNV